MLFKDSDGLFSFFLKSALVLHFYSLILYYVVNVV